MAKVEIISKVVKGTLTRNRVPLQKALKQFEGKDIVITIKEFKNKRSSPQNRYYWGVIIKLTQNAMLNEWGEWRHESEIHEFLKYNCNSVEKVNENTGEIIRIARSTTDNQTNQQEVLHEKCRRLVLEYFNVIIPLPNEILKLEL